MNNINVNIFLLILLTSKTVQSFLLMTRIEILLMLFINIKVNNIYTLTHVNYGSLLLTWSTIANMNIIVNNSERDYHGEWYLHWEW